MDFSKLDDDGPEPLKSIAMQEVLDLRALWLPIMPMGTTIVAKHELTGLTVKIRVHPSARKAVVKHLEWLAMIRLIEEEKASPLAFSTWLKKKRESTGAFRIAAEDPPDPKSKLTVGDVLAAYGLVATEIEVEDAPPNLRTP